jgi:hypothetical protein
MNPFTLADYLWTRLRLWSAKRHGLRVADDCRFHGGLPEFGTEPYLISIGQHVAIAANVAFLTHDGGTHVFRDQERYRKVIKYGRITVYDNCVIGYGTIILPGVTIGPNSVVGAGSVVTRSIPPGVLASGNPAKPVMTIQQYAEWSLASTPEYDQDEYLRDKRAVLLKIRLKGDGPPRPAPAPTPADAEEA